MPSAVLSRRLLALLIAAACAAPALAQETKKEPAVYEPSSGQAGKDVVWVPTPQVLSNRMLDMAKVTKKDFVMDLGSGDGRTVIAAAKRGAKAVGIEYNPDMVELSKKNAEREGVTERATFMKADLFETDFSKATVVTLFLLPDINIRLRPKILNMRPGTRVVSNSFNMGDWGPDQTVNLGANDGCEVTWCTAFLWIVPAKVAGTYQHPKGNLTLKQTYQKLSGTLEADGKTQVVEGKVNGREVTFTTGGQTYKGKANGKGVDWL
jgi:SAM-dependent methyltransferase